MKGIECGIEISVREEAIKKAVALSNYADNYIIENDVFNDHGIAYGDKNYISKMLEMRNKIYIARLKDYKDYPELVDVDYNLQPING